MKWIRFKHMDSFQLITDTIEIYFDLLFYKLGKKGQGVFRSQVGQIPIIFAHLLIDQFF